MRKAFLLLAFLALESPLLAFTDSDFLQDLDDSAGYSGEMSIGSDRLWSADFGVGMSIPKDFTMLFPALNHIAFTQDSALLVVTDPFPIEFKTSFSMDASVHRKMASWMSLGGQVSYAFNHAGAVGRESLEDHAIFIAGFTTKPPLDYNVSASLKILEFTPILKVGPGLHSQKTGLRPYLLGGVGGYYVIYNAHIRLDDEKLNFFNSEKIYLGATAGVGLAWKTAFGKIALEGRYQKIFQTQTHLEFLIPALRFSSEF